MKTICLLLMALCAMPLALLAADDSAAPPADALWTIHCAEFSGPNRAAEAKRMREIMVKTSGIKPWFVVHQSDQSTLYFGYYRSVRLDSEDAADKKDAQRAHDDIKKIRSIQDEDGNKILAGPFFSQVPQSGTEGPPEWNLLNTPPDKHWSLLIGVYRENPDRRKAAVAAVKALRDDKVEAYYLHDDVTSLVFVGAWAQSAVKLQAADVLRPPDSSPDTKIIVLNRPLPKDARREWQTPDGKKILVFAPDMEVLDPTMQLALDRHPYFMTNGQIMGREVKNQKSGKNELLPNRSSLFIIPRKDSQQAPSQPPAEAVRAITPPDVRKAPGSGTLKKLED